MFQSNRLFSYRLQSSCPSRKKKGLLAITEKTSLSDYTEQYRLYRTILHFLNVHDSCTLSVCDEKLRNDLIKGTDYTPDYLGSIKNDGFQQNI